MFGKTGRADSAKAILRRSLCWKQRSHFVPRDRWRPGMTPAKLVEELDKVVSIPGIANVWVPPIRNRLDMLATGIKSPVGIKVNGSNIADIERVCCTD